MESVLLIFKSVSFRHIPTSGEFCQVSELNIPAEECLFGQNWAKISRRVRTFARIKKVTWDQLLATNAEIIQS